MTIEMPARRSEPNCPRASRPSNPRTRYPPPRARATSRGSGGADRPGRGVGREGPPGQVGRDGEAVPAATTVWTSPVGGSAFGAAGASVMGALGIGALGSFPRVRRPVPEACGLRHMAFAAADLDAAAHLQSHGIAVEPVRVDGYTGERFTFFADSDGPPLELYELRLAPNMRSRPRIQKCF